MNPMTIVNMPTADVLSYASQPMPDVAQRFADMLNRAPTLSPIESGETTAVTQVLLAQDEAMRKTADDYRVAAERVSSGADDEMSTSTKIHLLDSMSQSYAQFQACSSLGQSVKNGVQTLMRTQ